jgi:mannose-1-phosphate guanylyltransferase
MVMLPADHAVMAEDRLIAVLREAVELAAAEPVLVTIGIQPTAPNTAYGYIKRGVSLRGNAYMVHRFFEKPNQERANSYYESGQFVWNSGMFVARVDTIMNAFEEHMPPLYNALERIASVIGTPQEAAVVEEEFQALESVSIDFGVLEHARNCAVVCADQFGWNDVGAWDAWADHFAHDKRGNLCLGDVLAIDSQNCVIRSEHKLTAVVGASDLVVIDSGDALLVCPKGRVQDVKLIVEELKKRGRTDLL